MSNFDYENEDENDLNKNDTININPSGVSLGYLRNGDAEDEELEPVEMMDDDDETSSSSSNATSMMGSDNENPNSNQPSDNKLISTNRHLADEFSSVREGSGDKKTMQPNISSVNNVIFGSSSDDQVGTIDPALGVEVVEESEDRKRFQIELEFVQSLANPNYLNFLAQRDMFRNEKFLNYLKYLMYWSKPEYCKYLVYPECLALLELLQHEQFLKEIVNAQCSKYVDEQLLLIWLHYKKRRDWIRVDPTKIPNHIEHLIKNEKKLKNVNTSNDNNTDILQDFFSASKFLENEKF